MRKLRMIVVAIVLVCSHLQSEGQTADLDTVLVTATLHSQKTAESGRDIQIIRSGYFKELPVQNIDDVLRFIPGIEVQQRGAQGSQSDIIIRGGTFQQVLVVIDGVRINDPLTGHFNGYIPLHPEEIERVEILKGAAAAIHGPDAVGGVVNIITKSFVGKIQSDQLVTGVSVGSFGMLNGNIYGAIKKGKSSVTLGVTSNNANGQPLRGTTGFFNNGNAVMSLFHQFNNKWQLGIRGAMDVRDFNAQNFYTTFLSDTAREKVKSQWIQAQAISIKGRTTKTIQLAYKHLDDEYQFRPSSVANRNKTDLVFMQVYRSVKFNKTTQLTFGEQAIFKKIISNDRGNHDHFHAGFYGIFSHKISQSIHLNETFRIDWDRSYGWIAIPQFNVSWAPRFRKDALSSPFNLRLNIGRGIRDADFTERYNNYNKTLVTSGSIGNPELSAERSWNYEGGVDIKPFNKFKITSTVFSRVQTDLIDWIPTKYDLMPRKINLIPTGNYALASNLASVITRGIEVDLEWSLKMGERGSLKFMSGLLWLKSKANNEKPLSFYLSSHARFLWNGNALVTFGKTSLSVGFVHKTRQIQNASSINASITPSYFICNGRLNQMLTRSGSKIFIQADNALNMKYSDLLGSVMPGRWLSIGLLWVFKKD